MSDSKRLGELSPGQRGTITRVGLQTETAQSTEITQRLLEMGLLEGSDVELVYQAPFGGDPIAVRVRGALIALRRNEANQVEMRMTQDGHSAEKVK